MLKVIVTTDHASAYAAASAVNAGASSSVDFRRTTSS